MAHFATSPLSMSTRVIADLTGKAHTNVLRDFREVCEALEIDQLSFESMYQDAYGREQIQYLLPKDLTTTLVSGYSIPMRHKIVQRWFELEAKEPVAAIPSDYAAALRLAATQHEALQVASTQLAIAAPKVKVYDDVIADKSMSLRTMVRMFHGVNTMQTQSDLTRMGYLYRNCHGINVYAKYKDIYFSERVIEQGGFRQIVVCAKGKELLSSLYAAEKLTMKVGHHVRH